jgi:DNA-binding MarR family transcriptional regulator
MSSMIDHIVMSRLETLRRAQATSLGYVLIRCGQLFNDRGIARVNATAGKPTLREAHTRLIPHLQEPGGIRVTELARRIGITKQGAQQLVSDMVSQGVVCVDADPDDKRARRVMLTKFGYAAMMRGTGQLLEIEAEVAQKVGKAKMKQLRRLLTDLLAALEAEVQ